MTILKLENVTKIYEKRNIITKALDNISLEIKEKEIVVVLGPSGSGKSTLLNILSGIELPSSGKITFKNSRIDKLETLELIKYRKDNIGFIFQNYNLIPNLTVKENIEVGSNLTTNSLEIDELLKLMDIEEQKNKFPSKLSGGEMQRVAIARAIAKNSKILICDEPTGALDEENGKKVLNLLKDINKKYGTTIIIVTHNPSVIECFDVCKVIKLKDGKIEFCERRLK